MQDAVPHSVDFTTLGLRVLVADIGFAGSAVSRSEVRTRKTRPVKTSNGFATFAIKSQSYTLSLASGCTRIHLRERSSIRKNRHLLWTY